jgi:hypothetical protein
MYLNVHSQSFIFVNKNCFYLLNRSWISKVICRGLVLLERDTEGAGRKREREDEIVSFVDIGGIDAHYCLIFFFFS